MRPKTPRHKRRPTTQRRSRSAHYYLTILPPFPRNAILSLRCGTHFLSGFCSLHTTFGLTFEQRESISGGALCSKLRAKATTIRRHLSSSLLRNTGRRRCLSRERASERRNQDPNLRGEDGGRAPETRAGRAADPGLRGREGSAQTGSRDLDPHRYRRRRRRRREARSLGELARSSPLVG